VLLGVEEEAPSDMMTMVIWLIEGLAMKSNGDETVIERRRGWGDLFRDRQALIPYQTLWRALPKRGPLVCIYIRQHTRDYIEEITSITTQDGIESVTAKEREESYYDTSFNNRDILKTFLAMYNFTQYKICTPSDP
jgi:hypothetical protein